MRTFLLLITILATAGVSAQTDRPRDSVRSDTITASSVDPAAIEAGADLLVAAYRDILDRYVVAIDPIELAGAALRGMIDSLDRYSHYQPSSLYPAILPSTIPPMIHAAMLPGNVVYVSLYRFERSLSLRFRSAVLQHARYEQPLEEVAGLLLDLRGNTGGSLDPAIEIADMLLPVGAPIVSIDGRIADDQKEWKSRSPEIVPDLPIIVLVDDSTASSAEVLAAALQQNGRAELWGNETHGKGLVQLVRPLPDGATMQMTTAWYRTPEGWTPGGDGTGREVIPAERVRPGGLLPDSLFLNNRTLLLLRRLEREGTATTTMTVTGNPVEVGRTTAWVDTVLRDIALADAARYHPLLQELARIVADFPVELDGRDHFDGLVDEIRRRDTVTFDAASDIFRRWFDRAVALRGLTGNDRVEADIPHDILLQSARRALVERYGE